MTKVRTVRYIGETSPLELTNGKLYKVLSVERSWYRIIDDTGEDYLYPAGNFEVIEETTVWPRRGFHRLKIHFIVFIL